MTDAIAYRRLSDKDQSNSLAMQETAIINYCVQNNLNLKQIFTDNGRSAFTFNRPEWIKLEAYLKKNKNIRYLVIYHLDRFSRATLLDALLKLREIEERLRVKVVAVNESIKRDDKDLSSQLTRIMQLMFANNEYNRIKQRVTDGMYQNFCSGRYVGMAPFGYVNTKLSKEEKKSRKNEPVIKPDPIKSKIVQEIFSLYNSGLNIESIRKLFPPMNGLKSNSAIQRILRNPLYAGIVKVPKRENKPSFEVNGIHEPIVTRLEYYRAQSRLDNRKAAQQPDNEVYLRGILACECGRKLTAGKSTGKSGRQYWYYKCNSHTSNNYPAKRLHNEFDEILNGFSFTEKEIEGVRQSLEKKLKERGGNKGGAIMRLTLEKEKLETRLKTVQQKYLLTESIDEKLFTQTANEIKGQIAELEMRISKEKTDTDTIESILELLVEKLNRLSEIFHQLPLHKKHAFLNILFPQGLSYTDTYTTPSVNMFFADKALILNKKGMLKLISTPLEVQETPIGTGGENCIQHHLELLASVLVAS